MSVEECIFYQLAKTNQAGNRVWKKAMSGFNVTASQGIVLNFLHDEDRVTSKELGERILLDSATLTGILDRLEKAGLIERLQHPTDRRSIIVGLTAEGRKVSHETYKEIERANRIFLQILDEAEQKEFRAMLKRVRDYSDKAFAEIDRD